MDFFVALINSLTCFAVSIAVWQLLFHARQMHRDLEMHYVDQYWRIMESTSTEWRLTHFLGTPVSTEDFRAVLNYLQLCEDEIELRANARVTDSTWKIWSAAIAFMVSTPTFSRTLAETPELLLPRLKEMMSVPTPRDFDPLAKTRVWRRLHGL